MGIQLPQWDPQAKFVATKHEALSHSLYRVTQVGIYTLFESYYQAMYNIITQTTGIPWRLMRCMVNSISFKWKDTLVMLVEIQTFLLQILVQ